MTSDPAPLPALIVYLAILALQRAAELVLSARNAKRLSRRGGCEVAGGHFPWIVALHVAYPLALAAEVLVLGTRPPRAWPALLVLWLGAQVLRYTAMRALGDRWNVRIWVVPGEPRVRRGIYRWLAHPNYVAVAVELIAAPLMFGAWRTAIAASVLDACALSWRIRAEESALRRAEAAAEPEPGAQGDAARGR